MQSIRGVVLKNMRIKIGTSHQLFPRICRFSWIVMERGFSQEASTQNASENFNHLTNRVLGLVKKFGKIDSSKVTETADFQKDLCLDSLDRVELVMAFEQEFSIEIPDEKADKINCCADAVQYIASQLQCNIKEGS